MGHAWCKEKTTKAQDSKSPLDRVFVRCAHTIYPSLKEEGSVLGGATQRVTSSEIGYAGSPPRDVLTRGRSIDSVDRPFHPSDWVDVNLEVPSTPRASSVVTNLTVDTSLHPATSPTSSCSNINKSGTPVPPPRRKKRNRGRPLPPKPDESEENSNSNSKHGEHGEEPLYSSVKSPKVSEDEQEEECRPDKSESRRIKEIYEHKVNGTGKVISSDMVSGKRTSWTEEKKGWRISELSHQEKKIPENEEYDSFVRNQSVKDSSTPNNLGKRTSKESEKQIKDTSKDIVNESEAVTSNTRSKNYSTVSLPNYDELDVKRHSTKEIQDVEECEEKKVKPKRPIRCSTVSLPAENCLSPFSQKTSVRLEDYIPTTKDLPAYQVLENLECTENGDVEDEFVKYDSNKLKDWDLNDIRNCDLNHQRRLSHEFLSLSETLDEKNVGENEDVVDFAENVETDERERKILPREEISDRYVTRSPVTLQKPEAFGKASSPILDDHSRGSSDWMGNQNGPHLRYFEAPTLSATCRSSPGCNISDSGISRQPFYLNEEKHRSALDTIAGEGGKGGGGGGRGSCRNGAIMEESDRLKQSRMIFGRSLSNESEPFDDTYESKELRDHTSSTGKLIKTISEESLPREMLEEVDRELDDFFDEKLAKDVHNKLKKECEDMKVNVKTPPPSPEPKIQAEIVDNDHSTLLKVLKEEAAEESNLSSMTPSLTELEAALSDMLEKEEPQEETVKSEDKNDGIVTSKLSKYIEKPIEPEIVPIEKNPSSFTADSLKVTPEPRGRTGDKSLVDEDLERKEIDISVFPGDILEEKKPVMKSRKVSFCAWEENGMMEIDLKNDLEYIQKSGDLGKSSASERIEEQSRIDEETRIESGEHVVISSNTVESLACRMELPPEKPSRLHRNPEELADHTEIVPTPPRRKRRNSLGPMKKEFETSQNESSSGIDTDSIDRLI